MKRVDMKGLSFCLASDDLLLSTSVMSIKGDEGTKQSKQVALPMSGQISTVFDPRLGTVTPGILCSTCSSTSDVCNGHTGHISLCAPVISALFLPIISKVLNCICAACGTLLLTLTDEKVRGLMKIPYKKRLTELNNRSLKVRGPCRLCQFEQPLKWILIDNILIRPTWVTTLNPMPIVTPLHVSMLLSLIQPRVSRLFGFDGSMSHPSSMLMSLFPIPPTMMRPSRSSRLEDDLSTRLRVIVQANSNLSGTTTDLNLSIWEDRSEQTRPRPDWKPRHQRNKKVLVPEHLETYFDLQRQCAGFQDSKYCVKNDLDYGRELASVRHRFVATRHRRGRVRANILGKRGDFTARAVASPNTYMNPHEVGVPQSICQHLTMKERVCSFNYQRMQYLVYQGPNRYPGANYVERNGERFLLPFFRSGGLHLGDIVHRHLQRGDMVIMNRQPSLHRFSMMGYSVVPMKCNTFQLHLSVTKAHNLDFDGDEVNLFVAGSIDAVAEIQELMAVHQNLFKDGELLVGFVQHACLAVYLLTRDSELSLTNEEIQQMLFTAQFPMDVLDSCMQGPATGRTLLQMLLPVYDGTYVVTKAKLNSLASRYLSASHRSTGVHRSIWIGCMVRFLEEFLIRYGSTLSYKDCVSTHRDTTLIETGVSVISRETDEAVAIRVSDKLRNVIGSSVYVDLSTRPSKNLLDIVDSGSKGNISHIVQNVGMVGQQFDVSSNRHRALLSHDVTPAIQRGLVVSSFSDGLGPIEFFHHLISARIGLIGTAVSTAETGYCYRRISKCLEDVRIAFDHSVRTATGHLVTLYGGFTSERMYRVPSCRDTPLTDRERARLPSGPVTIIREYTLPFDIRQLAPGEEKDHTVVTQDDIFDAVGSLWDRVSIRFVPAHMERILFDLLSVHQLSLIHTVRTRGRLDEILVYVEEAMCRSLYPPGTPIGLIVSQSFSEPLTQIQLNQFHHSGEGSGLVSGVTRIKEIINCMKDIQTPSMTIVPLAGHTIDVHTIISVSFRRVMHCWTTNRHDMVTIVLDKELMVSRCVTPRIVADVIGRIHDNIEYTQDLEATVWELWFPLEGEDTSPLRVRDVVRSLVKTNPLIKGIKDIHDFYMSTIDLEYHGTIYKRPCMITKGSNLVEICKLPWVDIQYTTTNDLMEIYAVFGIDAICSSIEFNLLQVMSSNSADISRNYIHVIAHEMCRAGSPCALTFNGLTSSNTSTLKLATFERSLESFVRAACMGHTDHLRGISESVIVGKPVTVGTGGDFELIGDATVAVDSFPPLDATTCLYPPIPCDVTEDIYLPHVSEEYLLNHKDKDKRKRTPSKMPVKGTATKKQKTQDSHDMIDNPFLNKDNVFIPYCGDLNLI
jgi:DNA-directed RNA polymerase subunit A'